MFWEGFDKEAGMSTMSTYYKKLIPGFGSAKKVVDTSTAKTVAQNVLQGGSVRTSPISAYGKNQFKSIHRAKPDARKYINYR